MSYPSLRPEYSIASVSKLTGVSCHALRVWERRYGYPIPYRSESGHRRYDAEQVRVLLRVAERLQAGASVSELMTEVKEGRLGVDPPQSASAALFESPAVSLVDRLMEGDLDGAEAEFQALAGRLAIEELVGQVLEPALVDAGERWFRGRCAVFQEHVASGFLRRKLHSLLDAARRKNGGSAHSVITGTVRGDRHEGGALILSALLERAGWRTVYLGVDLPVAEYQGAIERWRPDAVALSFVLSRNINKRFRELAQVRGAPIFVGGRSILNYQGLARRNGLIPLVGSAPLAVRELISRVESVPALAAGE